MKIFFDKREILGRIKDAFEFTSDTQLSEYLGISKATLSNWYSRNSMDYELVFSKCERLNSDWLLTGKGEMLKSNTSIIQPVPMPLTVAEPSVDYGEKGIPYWDLPVSAGKSVVDIVGKKKPDGYIYNLPGADRAENIFPVIGMSMGEEVPEGSIIGVCKMNRWESLNTERIYMIITRDDRMVKRIAYDEDNEDFIWCVSPNYPRFKVSKEEIIEIQRVCFVYAPK